MTVNSYAQGASIGPIRKARRLVAFVGDGAVLPRARSIKFLFKNLNFDMLCIDIFKTCFDMFKYVLTCSKLFKYFSASGCHSGVLLVHSSCNPTRVPISSRRAPCPDGV